MSPPYVPRCTLDIIPPLPLPRRANFYIERGGSAQLQPAGEPPRGALRASSPPSRPACAPLFSAPRSPAPPFHLREMLGGLCFECKSAPQPPAAPATHSTAAPRVDFRTARRKRKNSTRARPPPFPITRRSAPSCPRRTAARAGRTLPCSPGTCARPRCWRASWGWGRTAAIGCW